MRQFVSANYVASPGRVISSSDCDNAIVTSSAFLSDMFDF